MALLWALHLKWLVAGGEHIALARTFVCVSPHCVMVALHHRVTFHNRVVATQKWVV